MLYSSALFLALLLGGVASTPTGSESHCPDGICGGVCGDGIVQAPYEQCDLGARLNGAPDSGCSADCKAVPVCGDGKVEGDEECDLGRDLNGQADSGCSADCKCQPVCGNGRVEPGEECDAGPRNGAYNSGCSTECKLCGYCGDGVVDRPAEQCDLGWRLNGSPGASCSAECKMTGHNNTNNNNNNNNNNGTTGPAGECGDGIVQPGEHCDDGARNGAAGWRCAADCTWASGVAVCGNGVTEWPEECDDGAGLNGTPASHCAADCTLASPAGRPRPPVCGNGLVEYPDEQCDDGYLNGTPGSRCTTFCRLRRRHDHHPCPYRWCGHHRNETRCGDGRVDASAGEECDEGDHNNGRAWSACDAHCKKKPTTTTPGGGECETCNPNPFFNRCTITTSCIAVPPFSSSSGSANPLQKHYCACRAGYRATGLAPTDPRQFRLPFPGQEYRVFVAPGVDCDALCTNPHPGPESCREVPVRDEC